MLPKILNFLLVVELSRASYFINKVNHMEYYRNRTRPSKAFTSFSTSYFNQNIVHTQNLKPEKDKVMCGTRMVDFNPRRTAKIVGGAETPYGAFPWQVSSEVSSFLAAFAHLDTKVYQNLMKII